MKKYPSSLILLQIILHCALSIIWILFIHKDSLGIMFGQYPISSMILILVFGEAALVLQWSRQGWIL